VLDPWFLRVGDLLARAFERHPEIELDLRHVLSHEALAGVRSGELDASFYFGALPDDLTGVALRSINYRVLVPNAWADALSGAPWESMSAYPWIITPELSSHRHLVEELFRDRAEFPPRTIEADNESVITNLVESGVGISLVREEIALPSAEAGRSAIWPEATIRTGLWLVHAANRRTDPLLVALLDVLHEVWTDELQAA
jgi:DNA-binding transcriptional LysR family regulator